MIRRSICSLLLIAFSLTRAGSAQEDAWQTKTTLGWEAFQQARYAEAEQMFSEAMTEAQKAEGAERRLALATSYLADLYRKQGRYRDSESLYARALALAGRKGKGDLLRAGLLHKLGQLLADQGQSAQAEALYRHSLKETERAVGTNHKQVAMMLSNLGQFYIAQRELGRARDNLERAVAMWRALQIPENPEFATMLSNLGAVYYEQRKYAPAEALYQRALAIEEASPGLDASVARDLNNLATVYLDARRFPEAESLYRRSLAISERTAGSELLLAQTLHNWAELCRKEERFEEAEVLYQRAAAVWEKALGPENPEFIGKLELLATAYRAMALYMQAGNLQSRAAEIRVRNGFRAPRR